MSGNTYSGQNRALIEVLKDNGHEPPLKLLTELAFYELKRKYPEIRTELLMRPKFSDKTANGLTKCIITWIKVTGGQAERINTTGRPIDRRTTYTDCLGHKRQIGTIEWIPGTGTKGSADISATINGRSVKIEVKIGKDRQSKHQIQYQASVEKAGGVYIIARTFEGFFNDWKRIV